ncbi:vWA domain-containing protein [Archangium primigenium]|uniref:vWA domain-containing protein n=1 Tax=[Archangium] primigenium TaxID=2792470 RepID=UPI001959A273|nr:VWA domain-containing protein [Archangium primigenium]MBM7114242.1 VWA domain-containing protein [Archangium primigenium]
MLPDLAFHSPQFLWGLLLLPLLIAAGLWEKRRRAVLRFSAAHVFAQHRKGLRTYLLPLLPLLRLVAVASAVVALARPQTRDTRVRDLNVEGIDIVVALDLSTSMEAGDFRPQNRLHVAKEVLADFISSRVNDRIGLVVFAGSAYTQAPLTLDYGVLKEVLRQLRTRVLEDGTAIGDALATSLNRLRDSDAKSRVVVLITDGDNNAGKISPLDAAGMARSLHVPVYTILVGKGGKVPFPQGTDLFGNTVWRETEIPINPELMQDIASSTGGEYYRATDPEGLKQGLQKVLDSLDRTKLLEGGASANYRENFHPYLLLAFGLAVLELFLRSTLLKVLP